MTGELDLSPSPPSHPAPDVLKAFAVGKVPQEEAKGILDHLETCALCMQTVVEATSDRFVDRMRRAQGQNSPNPRPATQSLAIPPESVPTEPPPSTSQPALSASLSESAGPVPEELQNNLEYELLRELGRGGMGVVYLARNRMMNRLEVLKVMNQGLVDEPGNLDRFLREIQAAAQLSHPNIVNAYAARPIGKLIVFAMEYIDGDDLSKLVKARGPLPVINAGLYAQQAALGLQHAFEKRMAHRDIKPANLILARKGKKHAIKILDFGLAKITSETGFEGGLTGTGMMLGTPDYIAPEQILDAQAADSRADIYSLGCTLYYLLTGGPPFRAGSLDELLYKHREVDPTPVNQVRPEVPAEMAAVAKRMMAKDPAHRYQSPGEVAAALGSILKGFDRSRNRSTRSTTPPDPPAPRHVRLSTTKPSNRTDPPEQDVLEDGMGPGAYSLDDARPTNSATSPGVTAPPLWGWTYAAQAPPTPPAGPATPPGSVPHRPPFSISGTAPMAVLVPPSPPQPQPFAALERANDRTTIGDAARGGPDRRRSRGSSWMLVTLAVIGLLLVLLGLWLTGALKAPARKERAVVEKTEAQGTPTPGVVKTLESVPAPIVGSVATTPPSKSSAPTVVTEPREFISPTNGMKFVRIPKGKFTMGSPKSEKGHRVDETEHEVVLSKDFYMGVYEVTRGEFRKFVEDGGYKTEAEADGKGGYGWDAAAKTWEKDPKYTWKNPGFEQSDDHPVVEVSWNDAVKYAAWLSKKDGREHRLPTEAEWEYACRGGSSSRFHFGDDDEDLSKYGDVADVSFRRATGKDWGIKSDDGGEFTSPVGRFKANPYGLYDMHGNVWEWCSDWQGDYGSGRVTDPTGPASGSYRVIRGGGWINYAGYCRSANRYGFDPSSRSYFLGFRLSLVPSGR